jgi:hypothetical protein
MPLGGSRARSRHVYFGIERGALDPPDAAVTLFQEWDAP